MALLTLCSLGAVCLASCDRAKAPAGANASQPGLEKTCERGPMKVRVAVDRREITIADRVRLDLEATIDETWEVELPGFGEKLEQFGIVDYRTPPPELVGPSNVLHRKTYVLEPFLSGEYTIPPMKVTFWKKGEKAPARHELETEALKIAVASLLPEKTAELRIKDIAPPVELPRGRRAWAGAAGALAMLAVAAAAILLARRKKRGVQSAAAARVPPHERAYRELEKLIAEDLIGKGMLKAFYQALSDILRRYIEARFGLRAPEQTTEEFLHDLSRNSALEARHKDLLKRFLNHCDLVKFAEHQPATSDIQNAFDSAKSFVVETEEGRQAA